MSDASEILDELLEHTGQLDGYGPWTEVGPVAWEQASKQGRATAYIEITTPGRELAEIAHLVALPETIPMPVFDDGAAADRARDAAIDKKNEVL